MNFSVFSWNCSGLDGDKCKWLSEKAMSFDFIFLSEVKCKEPELKKMLGKLLNSYDLIANVHKPSNLHGVLFLVKKNFGIVEKIDVKLDCKARVDTQSPDACCGRVLVLKVTRCEKKSGTENTEVKTENNESTKELKDEDTENTKELKDESTNIQKPIFLVGTYVPNLGTNKKHMNYRLQWDSALYNLLTKLSKENPTIWIGDLNVALSELDVNEPEIFEKLQRTCYTKEERANFAKYFESGWVDVWRDEHKNEKAHTHFGRPGTEPGHTGLNMRIDNALVYGLKGKCEIWAVDKERSDHAPIVLVVD